MYRRFDFNIHYCVVHQICISILFSLNSVLVEWIHHFDHQKWMTQIKLLHWEHRHYSFLHVDIQVWKILIHTKIFKCILPYIWEITFVPSNSHYNVFWTMFFQLFHPFLQSMEWVLNPKCKQSLKRPINITVIRFITWPYAHKPYVFHT